MSIEKLCKKIVAIDYLHCSKLTDPESFELHVKEITWLILKAKKENNNGVRRCHKAEIKLMLLGLLEIRAKGWASFKNVESFKIVNESDDIYVNFINNFCDFISAIEENKSVTPFLGYVLWVSLLKIEEMGVNHYVEEKLKEWQDKKPTKDKVKRDHKEKPAKPD